VKFREFLAGDCNQWLHFFAEQSSEHFNGPALCKEAAVAEQLCPEPVVISNCYANTGA
jgi:hypothetical protein